MPEQPFILTMEMDGSSFARLDDLRRRHYPPERNQVPAHVTLFRQLPGDRGRELKALLRAVTARQRVIAAEVEAPKLTETGVAFFLRAPALHALRSVLQEEWWPWLVDQDRAGFRPHVTVQNRVTAAEARRTRDAVAAMVHSWIMTGEGLHLWRYRGGPWEDVQLFRFARN